jgi:hypothetical protein
MSVKGGSPAYTLLPMEPAEAAAPHRRRSGAAQVTGALLALKISAARKVASAAAGGVAARG